MSVGIITGMRGEARLLGSAGFVRVTGGQPGRSRILAEELVASGVRALLSFGIAGGLAPDVPAGTLIIGRRVLADGNRVVTCDPGWCHRLGAVLTGARTGDILGRDTAVATVADKRALHAATGAFAVDMESHGVALAAAAAGLPFAVLRAVADGSGRALPPAALVGLAPDGRVAVGAVMRAVMTQPAQLPELIAIAIGSAAALRTLRRAVRQIGAFSDPTE
jgi:hopanoid-associated phosphorylase